MAFLRRGRLPRVLFAIVMVLGFALAPKVYAQFPFQDENCSVECGGCTVWATNCWMCHGVIGPDYCYVEGVNCQDGGCHCCPWGGGECGGEYECLPYNN